MAGIAGLANKLDGAQRARMKGIVVATLAGEDDDLHLRRQGQQVADQREALIRAMWFGWQPEIDQGQRRRLAQLSEQRQAVRAGVAGNDVKVCGKGTAQCVADQRVVIDNEEQGLVGQRCGAVLCEESFAGL